ncbi:MAG: beta-propeller fold lactonase family protein [Thermoleophilaceae bacterium]|nr:beta-propeller fold lactonase family protein [Thermoleophilaceae bacterium]
MSTRVVRACLAVSICLLASAASATAATRPLFSSQQLGATGLTQYSIDLETGALTQQGAITPSGVTPTVPGISPDGSRIYVSGYNDNQIHGFSIAAGGLTALAGFPVSTGGGPNETVVAPGGGALWTANNLDGSASAFTLDASGGLTEVVGSPYTAGGADTALAVSPRNSLMYVAGFTTNQLAGFSVGSGGALAALSGFPLAKTGTPVDVEYNVAGNVLFVADQSDDTISSYAINTSSGALTEVAGSPFAAGDAPAALAASADGKWLFVINSAADTIQSFAIAGDGALTPAGAPVATQSLPNDLAVTPDSRFVYTADYTSSSISGFSIGADGSLSPLSGSPFGDNSGAVASLAIVPDQGPVASFTASVKDYTASFNAAASADPDGSVVSYVWDFGDGQSTTTSSPQSTHTYAGIGNFNVSLRVIDNENCSNLQIGTGQTIACNGSAAAVTSNSVAPPGPLTLKHATGKQLEGSKTNGKVQRRVQIEFFLNRSASVSYQFQKSSSKGRCRKSTSKKKKKATYKNFGKKASYPATGSRNRRIFTGKFGGKTIVAGRYRVVLKATAPDSDATPSTTSASFCVS